MKEMPATGARSCIKWMLPFSVILMIMAVYSNTLTSPPFLDDFHSFIEEKGVYLDQLSISSIFSTFQTKFGPTRAIPVLTFALNHYIAQGSIIYFHLVNILIHIFAFVAVCFLTNQIITIEKKRNSDLFTDSLSGWLPICIAAIWALSPVQTNAVTYLVQRMASIQALFYFLAVGFYLKGRLCSTSGIRKPLVWYIGCLLASICAFLSKQNSVLLPFTLMLAEVWFFDSEFLKKIWSPFRRVNWVVWLVLGVAGIAVSIYGFGFVYSSLMEGYAKRHFTMTERLLTEGRIVIWYMSLLLWPDPGRLSMEHDIELSTSLFSPPTTLLSFILIFALIGGSICLRKKYPVITFGVLWYFINLALESTFLQLELIFEHRLYLPSFGLFLAVAVVLAASLKSLFRKLPESDYVKVLCSAFILFACCSGMATFLRNADWENPITIQYDCVTKAPDSPRANGNYANVLARFGQYEEAIKYAEKTLELGKPGLECYGIASNALVTSLIAMGKYDDAVWRGEELLANQPKIVDGSAHPYLCLNLARAYLLLDREQDAFRQILQAFKYIEMTEPSSIPKKESVVTAFRTLLNRCQSKEIDLNGDGMPDPGSTPPGLWIARELQKVGDLAFPKQLIDQEYAQNPDNTELAKVIEESRREEALNLAQSKNWDFSRKYVRQPFSRFNFAMGVAFLVQERRMPEIFQEFGEKCLNWALELNPNSADALLLAGWYAHKEDKIGEPVSFARKALEHEPENAKIWVALGVFLAKAGKFDDAIAALDKVVELYPGYPKRQMLESLRAEMKKESSTNPVSEINSDSNMKFGMTGNHSS